jgi:hypothetical protein
MTASLEILVLVLNPAAPLVHGTAPNLAKSIRNTRIPPCLSVREFHRTLEVLLCIITLVSALVLPIFNFLYFKF